MKFLKDRWYEIEKSKLNEHANLDWSKQWKNEKTFRDLGSGFVMKQKAFTLIELLVVVALNQPL